LHASVSRHTGTRRKRGWELRNHEPFRRDGKRVQGLGGKGGNDELLKITLRSVSAGNASLREDPSRTGTIECPNPSKEKGFKGNSRISMGETSPVSNNCTPSKEGGTGQWVNTTAGKGKGRTKTTSQKRFDCECHFR